MTTKLTLTVEKSIIEKAKKYARQNGKSLSELVESYLKEIVSEDDSQHHVSPKLKALVGVVRLPKNFDEKKELYSHYSKKHA